MRSNPEVKKGDLVLLNQAPLANIDFGSAPVSNTGGTLLCGGYQFVFRFIVLLQFVNKIHYCRDNLFETLLPLLLMIGYVLYYHSLKYNVHKNQTF